jgi:acyl-CoA synthetase (AMP-forming)/AMP-acid ligase II
MARRDEDGFYHLVDRKNNMIITGGENVYPSEVEEVVGSHEGVFECAVIGLPDPKWGERVTAVVIRKPGLTEKDLSEKDIIADCKRKIASYKRPKEIIFIEPEEMPRTGTGKILHRKLRDRFGR